MPDEEHRDVGPVLVIAVAAPMLFAISCATVSPAMKPFVGEWEWREGGMSKDTFLLILNASGKAVGIEDGDENDREIGEWVAVDDGIKMTLGRPTVKAFLDEDGYLVMGDGSSRIRWLGGRMNEREEQTSPEHEPKPQSSGARRPPGPPRRTGTEVPEEPVGPLSNESVIITRHGKPVAVIGPSPKKQQEDRGQQ